MTYGKGGRLFPGMGVATLAAAAVVVAACSTSTVEEGRSGSPTNTGTFPNLNVPQQAATAQFTEQERQAKLARLGAVQQAQASGAPVESPEARRRRLKLSADEQEETLKIIESE